MSFFKTMGGKENSFISGAPGATLIKISIKYIEANIKITENSCLSKRTLVLKPLKHLSSQAMRYAK